MAVDDHAVADLDLDIARSNVEAHACFASNVACSTTVEQDKRGAFGVALINMNLVTLIHLDLID